MEIILKMDFRLNKTGQIQSQIIWIFIIAGAILTITFGFKAYNWVSERACSSELINMGSDLKASLSAISSSSGTVEGKQYSVPCGIDKVYFIDLNEELDSDFDPTGDNENIEIRDSYSANVEKNVFFMKGGKIEASIYVPELKLKYPAYRCFEMRKRPRIDMYLEGFNGGANVVNRDDSANCGYIPVLMENEHVLSGGDTKNPTNAQNLRWNDFNEASTGLTPVVFCKNG